MTTIRAFIAIDLPESARGELGRVSHELAGQIAPGAVRWVRPEQIHLTLCFLGDTDTRLLPAVQSALNAATAGRNPFTLRLGGIGCFPNKQRPRVIWVGLTGDEARLLSLKMALDEQLVHHGWPTEDKPFRAHLTLGRVKDGHSLQSVEWSAAVQPLELPVVAVHLIESQLRPGGPIYTMRYTTRLTGHSSV